MYNNSLWKKWVNIVQKFRNDISIELKNSKLLYEEKCFEKSKLDEKKFIECM